MLTETMDNIITPLEKEGYTSTNTAFVADTVHSVIKESLEQSPHLRELRIIKCPEMVVTYIGMEHHSRDYPDIEGHRFVESVPRAELEEVAQEYFCDSQLPTDVRIIRPNLERDSYGIFVK